METHGGTWMGDEDNLTDVLWCQMQSVADAMLERNAVMEQRRADNAVREGIDLFIVDLIGHWLDRLAREPDAARRQELEELLRVVGTESRKRWSDAPDQALTRASA
jgi:hypothetical protein